MAANGILNVARNIMKFMTEGKGFDRVMRNVSISDVNITRSPGTGEERERGAGGHRSKETSPRV